MNARPENKPLGVSRETFCRSKSEAAGDDTRGNEPSQQKQTSSQGLGYRQGIGEKLNQFLTPKLKYERVVGLEESFLYLFFLRWSQYVYINRISTDFLTKHIKNRI